MILTLRRLLAGSQLAVFGDDRRRGGPGINPRIILGPVSYTHLDVYKRQWEKSCFSVFLAGSMPQPWHGLLRLICRGWGRFEYVLRPHSECMAGTMKGRSGTDVQPSPRPYFPRPGVSVLAPLPIVSPSLICRS